MTEDVPGYRVLEQVGEGGFSVVYRARQEHLDRTVALRSCRSPRRRRGDAPVQAGDKITGRLSDHPNIVTVLDTGTTRSGRPYIAMGTSSTARSPTGSRGRGRCRSRTCCASG